MEIIFDFISVLFRLKLTRAADFPKVIHFPQEMYKTFCREIYESSRYNGNIERGTAKLTYVTAELGAVEIRPLKKSTLL